MGITTSFKTVGDLTKEIYDDVIYSCYGASETGKTTLLLTLAYELMGGALKGKNICWYDTEGGAQHFIDQWDEKLRKRFKVPSEQKVIVRRFANIRDILKDHGYGSKIVDNKKAVADDPEKGIKLTFFGYPLSEIEEKEGKDTVTWRSDLEKFVTQNNIGMIVYDSITRPMEFFGSAQQNFPARADATGVWVQGMFDIMYNRRVYVWAIHHESINPQAQYDKPIIRGGETLHYNSKVIVYIRRSQAKNMDRWRVVSLKRYFNFDVIVKETQVHFESPVPTTYTILTSEGYEDKTEEEYQKAYKDRTK